MLRKALLTVAVSLALAGGAVAQDRALAIGTAPSGGYLYPLGGAIAKVISERVEGVQVTAEATAGSVQNAQLTGADPTYLGLVNNDTAYDAVVGQNKFAGTPLPLRTLVVLVPSHLYLITRADTGIDSIADLKGHRVSTNLPGSGIEVMALRVIGYAGLDPDSDISREKMSIPDSAAALKDGKIDAFFIIGNTHAAPLLELASTPGMEMKLVPTDTYSDRMNSEFGQVYTHGVIAAGTYPGIDVDVPVQDSWNTLVAHKDLSDEDAYNFAKAVIEGKADIVAILPDADAIAIANQVAPQSAIEFHPGALKYFREQGLAAN